LHSCIRLFGETDAGCASGSSHDESREAVPIVQATSKVGIVIGFSRFGTVPVVISLRLQQLAMVLRWWMVR
jgi:hypothetical protein